MFEKYIESQDFFNSKFLEYFEGSTLFEEALTYSIAEGKRVRPIILLETVKMITGANPDQRAINFAIGLELIHNYSLVHDDLPAMDDDDYRRGRLTVHKQFREDLAILVGDGLLNEAYEIFISEIIKSPDYKSMVEASKAAQVLAQMAGIKGMIGGQVQDVLEYSTSSEAILDMYKKKTCGLIMGATLAAGYLSSADEKTINDMYELGEAIGLCFQLQDDLLDYEEDKKINKTTYISFNGLDKTKLEIERLTKKAIGILQEYDNSKFLIELVNKLVGREY